MTSSLSFFNTRKEFSMKKLEQIRIEDTVERLR